jgi:hypothetical protein
MAEINILYTQCPTVQNHISYTFDHPVNEDIASFAGYVSENSPCRYL